MAKTKLQKQVILRDLEAKLAKSKAVVFARFNGFGVVANEELRNKLRSEDSEYYVAKKTLLTKALAERGFSDFNAKSADGQMAVIFGYGDEVSPAKTVAGFVKSSEGKIDFAGGILEGRIISKAEVAALATLPSREELYAKIVGSINAPISGFVNALAGNLRNIVYVLKAIEEKKS
jgi:large subunit ribosomal protein L10